MEVSLRQEISVAELQSQATYELEAELCVQLALHGKVDWQRRGKLHAPSRYLLRYPGKEVPASRHFVRLVPGLVKASSRETNADTEMAEH